MLKKNVFGLCLLYSVSSFAFDLEDYATTYRATRDAYLKAANEVKLASGPYEAARKAYKTTSLTYLKTVGNGKADLDQSMLKAQTRVCIFSSSLDDRASQDDINGDGVPDVKEKDKLKFELKPSPELLAFDVNGLISQEQSAKEAYFEALRAFENRAKEKAAASKNYSRAVNMYVQSLSSPIDMTNIKRNEPKNKCCT